MPITANPTPSPLNVRGLWVRFRAASGLFAPPARQTAVDHVDLDIEPGETLGLVGESGSGKSTLGRAILRLIPAEAGTVRYGGVDVLRARGTELLALRRRMQIIFQDPAGSLNPHLRVRDIVGEPMIVHGLARGRGERDRAVGELLERCGMQPAAASRYPGEFSGGQRQRIAIARALASGPSFVVCDEPTSALDVSVQAQILNLLADLQRDLGLSYLFISHDIGVIQHMSRRIAVMQAGRLVEVGARDDVLERPSHPYTRSLIAAVPHAAPAPA
jgi:peptide/nickel transport system ATP-binding protein